MSDATTPSDEKTSGPLCGERLSEARRKNDISVRDIAKELHLDEPTVLALEKNQFAALGAPVFAKGHLRKYAELVDVPIDDIMADYYQMNRSATAPPVVGPKRTQAPELALGRWIGGGVIVLLLMAIVYWWMTAGHELLESTGSSGLVPAATVSDGSEEPVAEPAAEDPAATAAPAAAPNESLDDAPADVAQSPPVDDANALAPNTGDTVDERSIQAAAAPVSSAPVAAPGEVALQLRYGSDCWTEISDATGRRLFYDLGAAGRVVSVSGVAPLRVVLGDATAVSITVNGADYPIPDSSRSGRLARLTIDP